MLSGWSCSSTAANLPPEPKTNPSTSQPGTTATQPAVTTSPSKIPRVASEELKQKMDSGVILLLVDIRFPEEYKADHITGAVLAPMKDILEGKWVPGGSPDQEIVVYCG